MRLLLLFTLLFVAACTGKTAGTQTSKSVTSSLETKASDAIVEIALRSARTYIDRLSTRETKTAMDEEKAITIGLKAARDASAKQLSVEAENTIRSAIRAELKRRR